MQQRATNMANTMYCKSIQKCIKLTRGLAYYKTSIKHVQFLSLRLPSCHGKNEICIEIHVHGTVKTENTHGKAEFHGCDTLFHGNSKSLPWQTAAFLRWTDGLVLLETCKVPNRNLISKDSSMGSRIN